MTDHRRFAPINLTKGQENPDYPKLLEALSADEKPRIDFMKACLIKLGLKASEGNADIPSLSRLHLSSDNATSISTLASSLSEVITIDGDQGTIKAENDTFAIERASTFNLASLEDELPSKPQAEQNVLDGQEDKMVDHDKVVKRLVLHESTLPETKETPYFNHHAFFANLRHYQGMSRTTDPSFGKMLLYGEVVTSTSTLLDK